MKRQKTFERKNVVGILLSNCSALEIIDDNYKILKRKEFSFALKAYWKNGKLSVFHINDISNKV